MTPRHIASGLLAAGLLTSPSVVAAPELTVSDAIRAAWTHDARLQASSAQATSAARGAEAADWALGPTLVLGAQGTLTSQPSRTFALLLDQGKITAADFDPARLNTPQARGSLGLSAVIEQPLVDAALWAARRRAHAGAESEVAGRAAMQRQVALDAVRAYFSVRAAEDALAYAEDALRTAKDTESFVKARVAQDVLLPSEGSRSTAYRAQAEAERAAAVRQLARARTGFVLLVGQEPPPGSLVTPLVPPEASSSPAVEERPELRAARATLADTVLRAPFDAVVQRKWVSRGQLVAPGAPLLELDGTVVELTGTLSESEAAGLAVGAEVPFRVGTAEGTATVVALSPGGDPLSHRSAFRARPGSGAPALRSGDFGRIGVKGAGGPRRAVPRTAVVQRGDLSSVFVLADGRAALRWLRLGEAEGDQLPVLAGLAPGERVIDSPGNVRDGQRVEVAGD